MEKKSDRVRALVAAGKFKEALAITKGFRLGITRSQHDAMARAYECMVYPDFYRSIGKDPQAEIAHGISVIRGLYGAGGSMNICADQAGGQ